MKARRPPLIVIGTEMSVQYLKNLMLTNGVMCFNIGYNKSTIKLFTETLEDHSKAVKVMNSTNVEFHTYSTKGEAKKYRRYLIHGFDPEHPDDEIADELKERLGEGFVKAHRLNRKNQDGTKTSMAPILKMLKRNTNTKRRAVLLHDGYRPWSRRRMSP